MSDSPQALPASWRDLGRPLAILLVLVAAILVLRRIPLTIEVFIVATLIAYGINPLIRALAKKLPRLVVIVVIYALFLLLLLVGTIIVVPTAIDQLQTLFANGGDYLSAAQAFLDRQGAWINGHFGGHMLPPQLRNLEQTAVSRISDMLQVALSGLGTLVVSVINALVVGITGIVLSYYFLVNSQAIQKTFLSLFPERSEAKARFFAQEIGRVFGGFVGGQIILSAFSGVFTFLGLEAIQSQYAVLLGVLTGLLYAIPYLGVFVATLAGILLGFLQSWQTALYTSIIILVVTRFADIVLVPKVMSESVGVSPIAIIFSVFAFGELFGIWGVVLAIPAAALLKCLWTVWLYPWITGKPALLAAQATGVAEPAASGAAMLAPRNPT